MRSILKLIKLEVVFLKTSIILIGLILVLFTGALLSVVSVRIDVPDGMYDTITDKSTTMFLVVKNVTLSDAEGFGGDLVYGEVKGITSEVTAVADNGAKMNFLSSSYSSFGAFYNETRGIIVSENTDFSYFDKFFIDGNYPSAPGEMLISNYMMSQMGVDIGSEISFGENTFSVKGVFDSSAYDVPKEGAHLPLVSFYVVMDGNVIIEEAFVDHGDARDLRATAERLEAMGYSPEVLEAIAANISNIDLAEAFFMAMAIVLAIMVFFILYSLIATFYRQRRQQICRLKLLGATTGKIAGVYCLIAGLLIIIAVGIGSALSIAFNVYFMNLCSMLFDSTFVPHFHIAVPLVLLVAMGLFMLLLYVSYQRKIADAEIAQEVKHE